MRQSEGGVEAIGAALEKLLAGQGLQGSITDVQRVFGGNAREAWAFALSDKDGSKRDLIALVARGQRQIATELSQEAGVLRQMNAAGVSAPALIAADEAGSGLGGPTLVMERLGGTADLKLFLSYESSERGTSLMLDLADKCARLHDVELHIPLDAGSVLRSNLTNWSGQLDELPSDPALSSVYGWLHEHLPGAACITWVHGDLRPGNFLFLDDRITGLLDWELAHPGDPLEDLAWIYCRRWSPAGLMGADDFIRHYGAWRGITVDPTAFHYHRVFAEARFAVISLTAATMFAVGATTNIRHADRLREYNRSLDECLRLVEEDKRA